MRCSKLVITWLVAAILLICRSEAGKIDSLELLVGDWNTTIRCGSLRFASELFPPRVSLTDEAVPHARIGWERPRKFHCNLSLYPNGTFGLYPHETIDEIASAGADDGQSLLVRGRWILHPNPYCVTDRFYDQVVLHSYPRIKKKVVDGREEEILQSLRLDIQCRLTGHFSHGRLLPVWGRLPRVFARAKLSHGVVVLNQEFSNQETSRARPRIAATFAATRNIPARRELESRLDDDESIFGY